MNNCYLTTFHSPVYDVEGHREDVLETKLYELEGYEARSP